MLFNSYSPGVLVSPKLHPLGEAAWISQFLASRVCQQQMFPAKGGYKTFVLFQSHFSGLPGDAAFGNTEHFSQLPVEGIVIVATHDGKHIAVPKDTGGISLMLDEPSQCPVHESTVSNLPVLAVLFTLVRQHTFMTLGTPSPILQRIELTHPQLSAAMRTDTFTFLLVVIFTHSCLCCIHQFIFKFSSNGIVLMSAFLV